MHYPSTVVVTDPTPDVIVQPVAVPVAEAALSTEAAMAPVGFAAPGADVRPLPDLPPDEPPTLLEEGEAAFAAGQYDEARRLFQRAVMSLPDDAYAQLDYGLAHFALGSYTVAADAFRRALAREPDLLDRLPDVSTAYGVAGDFEKHLAALEAHVERHATDTDARLLHGLVCFSIGDAGTAISQLSRVLHQDPRDTVAYLLRDAALRAVSSEPSTNTVIIRPDRPE
ncbi:MAG: tetratricopeptide repeat protein [Phycisphaerales bacterium]|nr:MAG: tetratricopeptide repeat protein [Phycisphaerales bacterium]